MSDSMRPNRRWPARNHAQSPIRNGEGRLGITPVEYLTRKENAERDLENLRRIQEARPMRPPGKVNRG